MASPFKTRSATTTMLLLAVIIISTLLPECHAEKTGLIHHVIRRNGHKSHSPRVMHKKPPFKPGPWNQAHATFYEGGSGSFGINNTGLPFTYYIIFVLTRNNLLFLCE